MAAEFFPDPIHLALLADNQEFLFRDSEITIVPFSL